MEIYEEKSIPYQLRFLSNLNLPKVRATHYRKDTVKIRYRFMGQRVWAKLPIHLSLRIPSL